MKWLCNPIEYHNICYAFYSDKYLAFSLATKLLNKKKRSGWYSTDCTNHLRLLFCFRLGFAASFSHPSNIVHGVKNKNRNNDSNYINSNSNRASQRTQSTLFINTSFKEFIYINNFFFVLIWWKQRVYLRLCAWWCYWCCCCCGVFFRFCLHHHHHLLLLLLLLLPLFLFQSKTQNCALALSSLT